MELQLEWLTIIAFLFLLAASVFILVQMYICDNLNCKAFNDAGEVAAPGTKEYTIAVLGGLYSDSIWPFPFIGAAILSPLSLWILGVPITVKNFAIVFLISFLVIYFLFAFFGHHYIKFIANYVSEYIESNCPTVTTVANAELTYEDENQELQAQNLNDAVCIPNEKESTVKFDFKSFVEGFAVTFAAPVTVF